MAIYLSLWVSITWVSINLFYIHTPVIRVRGREPFCEKTINVYVKLKWPLFLAIQSIALRCILKIL